jgi:predicted dehydrogenase
MSVAAPLEVVMVGAGNRGFRAYGAFALEFPSRLQFVAVAEPDRDRRERFAATHGIPAERQFASWEQLASRPPVAAAALNATMDRMHRPSTLGLLESGYDILLEKPIAESPEACVELAETAERLGRKLQVCHVLRYAPFFRAIHDVVVGGRLGDLVSIDWRENLVYWHFVHSFVRGNWSKTATSGPMLLSKCCHDLDLLVWIVGSGCEQIASFGSQRHFGAEHLDFDPPQRCLDGCPRADDCLHYAPRVYLDRLAENPNSFSVGAITLDHTPEGIMHALRTGPYGRCAYRCDNDVVDHQVVSMQFPAGLGVTLTMQGASHVEGRTARIDGTRATLLANESRNEIKLIDHRTGSTTLLDLPTGARGGHGGGDFGLLDAFIDSLAGHDNRVRTSARESVESHLMAFAAEEARLSARVVDMQAYRASIALRSSRAAPEA